MVPATAPRPIPRLTRPPRVGLRALPSQYNSRGVLRVWDSVHDGGVVRQDRKQRLRRVVEFAVRINPMNPELRIAEGAKE